MKKIFIIVAIFLGFNATYAQQTLFSNLDNVSKQNYSELIPNGFKVDYAGDNNVRLKKGEDYVFVTFSENGKVYSVSTNLPFEVKGYVFDADNTLWIKDTIVSRELDRFNNYKYTFFAEKAILSKTKWKKQNLY